MAVTSDPVDAARLISVVLRDADELAIRLEDVVEAWRPMSHNERVALDGLNPRLSGALIKAEYYISRRRGEADGA